MKTKRLKTKNKNGQQMWPTPNRGRVRAQGLRGKEARSKIKNEMQALLTVGLGYCILVGFPLLGLSLPVGY